MQLTQFIQTLSWDALSDTTRRLAKLCTMDLIGCALAGSRDAGFTRLCAALREMEGEGDCAVWGTQLCLRPQGALFANSYAASLYDMDDGHRRAQGHPGAAIIPAALNVACQRGLPGRELLTAIVLGYDIAVRSALVMRAQGGPRKGSGAWVAPGVAAALARLLGLKGEAISHALGLAEYYAPQATQDRSVRFPSQMKEGLPWGATAGLAAARLAGHGMTAMRPHLADSDCLADLGEVFEIERSYFKKYACCRWAHPAIDGLARLQAETGLSLDSIESIRISTFEKALPLKNPRPKNLLEAVYSIPFAVGAFLVQGRVEPEQVTGSGLEDAQVLAMADRIELVEDSALTREFPEKCLERVELRFKDGRSWQSGVLSARGDPDDPYADAELVDKFRNLSAPVIGPEGCERALELLACLEDRPAADLVDLLTTHRG